MNALSFYAPGHHRKVRAFTLVEVLVAEAVFLILLGLALLLSFAIIQTVQEEKKGIDSLGEARLAMDRLSMDWAARVRRNDVTALFTKQAGNDQIALLSQVPGYYGARRMAWVAYQVGTNTQVTAGSQTNSTYALNRGLVSYNWASTDSGSYPLLSFPFVPSSIYVDQTNYEPLASTVFRMEFTFLANTTNASPYTANSSLNLTSTNLVGVVVAVAALDQRSRQIVTQAQLAAMANALTDVTSDGQDPQSLWLPILEGTNFAATAGVPKSVAGAVHVFQRTFYLNE